MTADDLAQVLRQAREEARLTRGDLARTVRVSEGTILRWEQGTCLSSVEDYLSALEACGLRITRTQATYQICYPKR